MVRDGCDAGKYKTDDLGMLSSDGFIFHQGRKDHQVKIRGFSVDLGEIEIKLVEYEDVANVVVAAREDKTGENAWLHT